MFRKIAITLLVVLILSTSLVLCSCAKVEWDDYMLKLNYSDGFKIMQLADIQAHDSERCDEAFVDIKKLVEKENPDLIVLTGGQHRSSGKRGRFVHFNFQYGKFENFLGAGVR